jgi:hypothetical protein
MTVRGKPRSICALINVGSALMPRISVLPALIATAIAGFAPAIAQQPQQPQQAPRPCAAIRQVCLQAGFVQNGARAGEGIVVDCIRPIMMGTAQRPKAAKPLPAVDPALVEACRARNPNFGMGNAQRDGPGQAPAQAPGQPPQAAPGPSADEPPQEPPAAPGQPPQAPPPRQR